MRFVLARWARVCWLAFAIAPASTFAVHAASIDQAQADHWTVQVTGGQVRGVVKDGVAAFKGIPFAAPPVGELRWKSPQPVKPWEGVREADHFGPAPMQPPLLAAAMGALPSEDCLYLNVWTPAKVAAERRPVMVWIYGGGFAMGATSAPVYDGTRFAKRGVVLVSIAYRVGPFGFLAHPQLSRESGGKGSGCYGIQDQIAALHWVHDNIIQFGGDPSRVTIFGESAGGISVGILAASPPARGLFQRAIAESGASMSPIKRSATDNTLCLVPSLAFAEARGTQFLADLGAADIQSARALDAETIQKTKLAPCWPVEDGSTIVGDGYRLYQKGEFNDTPILIGTNSDDGGLFALPTKTPDAFERLLRDNHSPALDPLLAAYPHATNAEAARSGRDLVREGLFAWPAFAWASLQSGHGRHKAYLYYFDHAGAPGHASHAAEIPYVFGALGGWFEPPATPGNTATSDAMMSYWVNFATTGDPNGPGLPRWPAFDAKATSTMTFGKTPHASAMPNRVKIEAFDAYFAQLRKKQ
jgi:para-nitrobenzyl esterase